MAVAIGYIYHHNDQASVAFGANVLKHMRETGHTNAVLIDPYGALIDYVGGGQSGDAAQKSLGIPFWDSLGNSSTVRAFSKVMGYADKVGARVKDSPVAEPTEHTKAEHARMRDGVRSKEMRFLLSEGVEVTLSIPVPRQTTVDTTVLTKAIGFFLDGDVDVMVAVPTSLESEVERLAHVLSFYNAGIGTSLSTANSRTGKVPGTLDWWASSFPPTVVRATIGISIPEIFTRGNPVTTMDYVPYTHNQGVKEWYDMVTDVSRHERISPYGILSIEDRSEYRKVGSKFYQHLSPLNARKAKGNRSRLEMPTTAVMAIIGAVLVLGTWKESDSILTPILLAAGVVTVITVFMLAQRWVHGQRQARGLSRGTRRGLGRTQGGKGQTQRGKSNNNIDLNSEWELIFARQMA